MTPQIGASTARESDTVSMGPIIGLGAREVCVFIVFTSNTAPSPSSAPTWTNLWFLLFSHLSGYVLMKF